MDAVNAKYGDRMIEVKLCFWTNNIAEGKGNIIPKHGWAQGVVRIERNESHDLIPTSDKKMPHFHSLLEIGAAVEELLLDYGIILLPSKRELKYRTDVKTTPAVKRQTKKELLAQEFPFVGAVVSKRKLDKLIPKDLLSTMSAMNNPNYWKGPLMRFKREGTSFRRIA